MRIITFKKRTFLHNFSSIFKICVSIAIFVSRMIKEATDCSIVIEFPSEISHYKYLKTIGTGAYSVVTLVEDVRNQGLFACKIFSRKDLVEREQFIRFEQETRIQKNIKHPNLIEVVDIIYDTDLIFVIMEHCPNGELFEYVATHPKINSMVIQQIFLQITRGLAFLHSKDISHRDIKPENIFLTKDLCVKIGDFGFAKECAYSRNGLFDTPCGSVYYAAPEILCGHPYDGKKSDIWSLGIVLFCLTTGALPWTESKKKLLVKQIIKCDYMIPDFLPGVVKSTIDSCLKMDPNQRPTAEEILNGVYLGKLNQVYQNGYTYMLESRSETGLKNIIERKRRSLIVKPEANLIVRIKTVNPSLSIAPRLSTRR